MITTLALFLATAQPAADTQWALRSTLDALGKVTRNETVYETAGQCEQVRQHLIWSMEPPMRGVGGSYRAWCVRVPR